MTATRLLARAALIAGSFLTIPTAQAQQPAGFTRTDLQRHDLSAPGREVVQVRVDIVIPANTIHAAKNVGKVTASELATYIVEKDQPLLTLVK
ncbi:hypothetical protein [Bradyrhizobium sp. CCBAU 53421]|uniref:hypothetical protein n=1 Tax=Bradyrhizobium sp. CCBAU 53421 TaxID=1325120 RepID=UPI00188BF404|nr:hypothetical protein [Bradyrhizobium sp. CCBAU 53421]